MYSNLYRYSLLILSLIPCLLIAESRVGLIERFLEGKLYSYEVGKAVEQLEEGGGLYRFAAGYEGGIDETEAIELNAKYDNPEAVSRFVSLLYSARLNYLMLKKVYSSDDPLLVSNGLGVLVSYGLFDTQVSREFFEDNKFENIDASIQFVNRSIRFPKNREINLKDLLHAGGKAGVPPRIRNYSFVWCLFLTQGLESWEGISQESYDAWLVSANQHPVYKMNDINVLVAYMRDSLLTGDIDHTSYLSSCNSKESLGYFFLLYYLHVHHPHELLGKYELEDFAERYVSSLEEFGLKL